MKVKILKCSDSMYWYSKHINEVFTIIRCTGDEYWTRERGMYRALNFICKSDCEVIIEQASDDSPILNTNYG